MTGWNILGWAMIAAFFGTLFTILFVTAAKDLGWKASLAIFGGVLGAPTFLILAGWLAGGELP